jgi:hypothetical protein
MYIMKITEVSGTEPWFSGPGWYYTDEQYEYHGPADTEREACEGSAHIVNDLYDRLVAFNKAVNSPSLIIPERSILQ